MSSGFPAKLEDSSVLPQAGQGSGQILAHNESCSWPGKKTENARAGVETNPRRSPNHPKGDHADVPREANNQPAPPIQTPQRAEPKLGDPHTHDDMAQNLQRPAKNAKIIEERRRYDHDMAQNLQARPKHQWSENGEEHEEDDMAQNLRCPAESAKEIEEWRSYDHDMAQNLQARPKHPINDTGEEHDEDDMAQNLHARQHQKTPTCGRKSNATETSGSAKCCKFGGFSDCENSKNKQEQSPLFFKKRGLCSCLFCSPSRCTKNSRFCTSRTPESPNLRKEKN